MLHFVTVTPDIAFSARRNISPEVQTLHVRMFRGHLTDLSYGGAAWRLSKPIDSCVTCVRCQVSGAVCASAWNAPLPAADPEY